jgi:lycopene cyclase domain-containing protein
MALLAVAAVILVDVVGLRTKLLLRRAFWTSYAIVLAAQLIMNGVLTGVPVVRYERSTISGLRIAYAPVEDLLFGFAMTVLTLSTWVALGRREQALGRRKQALGRRRPRGDSTTR